MHLIELKETSGFQAEYQCMSITSLCKAEFKRLLGLQGASLLYDEVIDLL